MMTARDLTSAGFPLYELLNGFIADDCVIDTQCQVNGITLDSRQCEPGFLFAACEGTQQHGIAFAQEALDAGAVAIIYEKPYNDEQAVTSYIAALQDSNVPVIGVEALTTKIGFIADRFYNRPSQSIKVTGVTGTNGKTSCSVYLANLLSSANKTAVMGTLGNGLPDSLEPTSNTTQDAVTVHQFMARMLEQDIRNVVMEVSSHGLDQSRVNGVHFETAIFTNLSRDHLDYHKDMQSYARSKQKLFASPGLRYAVINADDEQGLEILANLPDTVQSVAYSLSDAMNADAAVLRSSLMHLGCVQGSDLKFNKSGLSMHVTSPWGDAEISAPLYGRFNAENILAVLAAALLDGIRLTDAVKALKSLQSVPGRMQHVASGSNQPTVIVDYAHTPDALEQVLMSARTHCKKELCCVFGCGGDRDQGKRSLMGSVASHHADKVIITDDNPRTESPQEIVKQICEGISNNQHVTVEHDRAEAIRKAISHARSGDVIVIAGKGHEDYQLIGDQRLAFSDVEVAEKILGELAK